MYLATSVDGFIAGKDGDIAWLHRPEYATSKLKGLSYETFIATVDTLVMGRNTFEKALTFDPFPYSGTEVMVLTGSELQLPSLLERNVRVVSGKLTSPE